MNTLDSRARGKAPGGGGLGKTSGLLMTLIKKQFMELSTLFSMGKRRSKRGSAGGFAFTLILYAVIALSLGASMYALAESLSPVLLGQGEDWKLFVMMDILGIALATLITMFSADLTLFRAKDNEILLSMPIPPGYILLARMAPLYVIALMFTASGVVPAVMVYTKTVGLNIGLIVVNVIMLLALGFLSLALSAVLGWLVSLVNARMKGRGFASVIASLVFLGLYFFFYFQINKFTQALVNSSSAMADWIHKFLPPIYFVGLAHTGSVKGIIFGLLTIAVIFGVIYFVLSRTFRGVVINASKTVSYKVGNGQLKTGSAAQVLLKKEIRRFTSSSSYMMNCGLGSIMMIALAVAAIIKKDMVVYGVDIIKRVFGTAPGLEAGLLALVIFLIVSTCYYTMPSISLEGKSIWILQSLPIDPMKIFMSKIKMEYILCVPGILILSIAIAIVTKMSLLSWLAAVIACLAYTTFTAFFGLWINMKRPSFDWTNEAYPIKQGLNPLICLFGEWLLTLVLGALFFLTAIFIPTEVYLLLVSLILLGVSFVIYRWLAGKGRQIFAYMQ